MRDATISEAFQRFQSAVEHDVGNLTKQNVINRSRVYAWERVLFSGPLMLLKVLTFIVFAPHRVRDIVNMAQAKEVEEFNQMMEKRGTLNGQKLKIL